MKRIDRLREAGRLLAMYLVAAEYLAHHRNERPTDEFLADCYGSAVMGDEAELEESQAALETAYDWLLELSLSEEIIGSSILTSGESGTDSRPIIADGCTRIRHLLDGVDDPPCSARMARARWHTELAGALLAKDFPSEQSSGRLGEYERSIMDHLQLALDYSTSEAEDSEREAPDRREWAMLSLSNVITGFAPMAAQEIEYKVLVKTLEATRRSLQARIT